MPSWLARTDVGLCVSHRRLARRRTLPRALGPWVLDSGGFSELALFGAWRTGVDEYADAVARYQREIGGLVWAAPQDWMVEPSMLARTGLTVRDHQERTISNYLALRDRGPFIPVLQGWTPRDYHRHVELYAAAGVELEALPLVGLGSICRRQQTTETARLISRLSSDGLALHAFGLKTQGLGKIGWALASADSMAWSYRARRAGRQPGCTHAACNNCLPFALTWRRQALDQLGLFG